MKKTKIVRKKWKILSYQWISLALHLLCFAMRPANLGRIFTSCRLVHGCNALNIAIWLILAIIIPGIVLSLFQILNPDGMVLHALGRDLLAHHTSKYISILFRFGVVWRLRRVFCKNETFTEGSLPPPLCGATELWIYILRTNCLTWAYTNASNSEFCSWNFYQLHHSPNP